MTHPIRHTLAAPFRLVRFLWRKVTPEGAVKAKNLAMSLCGVAVVVGVIALLDVGDTLLDLADSSQQSADASRDRGIENQQTLRGLDEITEKIDAQTSPEAQARQQATLDAVIEVIGCENRATLQDLVDLLEERGVLEPGILEVVTAECRALEDERGG